MQPAPMPQEQSQQQQQQQQPHVDFIPLTGEYDGDGPILWKPVRGYPQIYQVSSEGSSESCKGIWGKYYFLNATDDGLYGPYDSFELCVRGLKAYMTLH